MKYTQPSLMNVDEFAPHVDDLDPGTLTREQWGARSDVYHHSGERPRWGSAAPNRDPAVHVGTETQATEIGGKFMHRLRVPKDRLTNKTLTDVGANRVHVQAAEDVGVKPDKSIYDSLDVGDSKPRRYNLHDGGSVQAEEPELEDVEAFGRGWAFPYVNSGEDVRREYPGAPVNKATYATSILAPQKTVRTWAQDVDASAAANPPEVRAATGVGPSSGVLQQRQFFGRTADHNPENQRYNRDQTMEPFVDPYKMPHLPHPETNGRDWARLNQRNWHRSGKGWEVQSPGLL